MLDQKLSGLLISLGSQICYGFCLFLKIKGRRKDIRSADIMDLSSVRKEECAEIRHYFQFKTMWYSYFDHQISVLPFRYLDLKLCRTVP